MIMTINSIYKETIEQIIKNEINLSLESVLELKELARNMNLNEDTEGLIEIHNTLVRLNGIMKKTKESYLGNNTEI